MSTEKNNVFHPGPELVFTDKMEFNRQLHLVRNRLIPKLNQIKDEFQQLGLGKLTGIYLNDILFDKMKLLKTKVESHTLAGIYEVLLELEEPGNMEFEILKDFPSVDEEGNIELNPEAIESIREFNSIYTFTEDGIKMFAAHKTAAEALNKLHELTKRNINPTPESIGELFSVDRTGKIIPIPVEYDAFYYSRRIEQRNKTNLK